MRWIWLVPSLFHQVAASVPACGAFLRDHGVVTVRLEQPAVSGWVTGKFVLEVVSDVPAGDQLPVATLRLPGDPGYFAVGVKHRYTRGKQEAT